MKYTVLILLMLAGCAAPVQMSDEERQACAAVVATDHPCTVWTIKELEGLARHFFGEGYKAGRSSI